MAQPGSMKLGMITSTEDAISVRRPILSVDLDPRGFA
jgi:hypothetical protein